MKRFYLNVELKDQEICLRLIETITSGQSHYHADTYRFEIVRKADHQVVGTISFKVGNNDYLYYAGNIGYEVYPQFRGARYALKAGLLMSKLARLHNMDQIIITCDKDNYASARTCELLGAEFIGTVSAPAGSPVYELGIREKNRYRLTI